MNRGKLLIAACCAVLVATPANAAWYIYLEGVDGESEVTSMKFKGGVRVATGDVNGDGTADASSDGAVDAADYTVWRKSLGTGAAVTTTSDGTADIVTGAGAGARTGGGPHVKVFDGASGATASSDVPTKTEDRASASMPGMRKYSNITLKRGVINSNNQPAGPAASAADEAGIANEPAALLLPAVQKVREAAARINAGDRCTVGPVRSPMKFRDSSTGKTARILDAEVVACEQEKIVFTFSHIEWD